MTVNELKRMKQFNLMRASSKEALTLLYKDIRQVALREDESYLKWQLCVPDKDVILDILKEDGYTIELIDDCILKISW